MLTKIFIILFFFLRTAIFSLAVSSCFESITIEKLCCSGCQNLYSRDVLPIHYKYFHYNRFCKKRKSDTNLDKSREETIQYFSEKYKILLSFVEKFEKKGDSVDWSQAKNYSHSEFPQDIKGFWVSLFRLDQWIYQLKKMNKKKLLRDIYICQLEKINGWIWDLHEFVFYKKFKLLYQFFRGQISKEDFKELNDWFIKKKSRYQAQEGKFLSNYQKEEFENCPLPILYILNSEEKTLLDLLPINYGVFSQERFSAEKKVSFSLFEASSDEVEHLDMVNFFNRSDEKNFEMFMVVNGESLFEGNPETFFDYPNGIFDLDKVDSLHSLDTDDKDLFEIDSEGFLDSMKRKKSNSYESLFLSSHLKKNCSVNDSRRNIQKRSFEKNNSVEVKSSKDMFIDIKDNDIHDFRIFSQNGNFLCTICNFRFSSSLQFDEHLVSDHYDYDWLDFIVETTNDTDVAHEYSHNNVDQLFISKYA